jgi:DnaJ-class molecular chaperone
VRKRVELMTGPAIELNVPSGVADGEVLRVPGYGFPGLGGAPPGDLNITVQVAPHEALTRDAFDVHMDLVVTDAQLGAGDRVRVPTIGGELAVQIPAGAAPGQVLRLRGMGIRDRLSGGRGDQYVHLIPTDT